MDYSIHKNHPRFKVRMISSQYDNILMTLLSISISDRDECSVVSVKERRLCLFWEEDRKEACESNNNCCFDDTDYGFSTVHCFASQRKSTDS